MESRESYNPWKMVFKGDLIAIEKHADKGFERAVRPPGVRLLLSDTEGKILITREYRSEIGDHDYRLPGGKVFNDLESYLAIRGNDARLNDAAMEAARLEAKQETGVDEINDLTILTRSAAGASVEWDLYYLTGTIGAISEQELEEDERERGIDVHFYTRAEVLEMLKQGKFAEGRTAAVLFEHLLK
jgi:8-oxo-dGTP pyrophosphatase MutT (NUDIX family)